MLASPPLHGAPGVLGGSIGGTERLSPFDFGFNPYFPLGSNHTIEKAYIYIFFFTVDMLIGTLLNTYLWGLFFLFVLVDRMVETLWAGRPSR